MKLSVVSWHVPEKEGTATGRSIWATCRGLLDLGHSVDVWSWGWQAPRERLPAWSRWEPLPPESWLKMKARALVRPRSDVARVGWTPAPDAVALAYEPTSFAAVRPFPRSAVVMHYATRLDAAALGDRTPHRFQDLRAERRATRTARMVVAYSSRVAEAVAPSAPTVPIAYPVPDDPVAPVDAPVALLLADWRWPPNRVALEQLLAGWPDVVERVPDARLLLAGRHFDHPASRIPPGVTVVGQVDRSRDALARAAVVAFPCPPSSGPKVKVIEAMAYGLPVVTTPAGAEGLAAVAGRDVIVADPAGFADALADVLADPDRRAAVGRRAREAIVSGHGPRPAAETLVRALRSGLGLTP